MHLVIINTIAHGLLTFLNQTSKVASSTGMKGAGFWPGRWEIARKYALSSDARSCSVAAGYALKNCSMNSAGLSSEENDWRREAFSPAF